MITRNGEVQTADCIIVGKCADYILGDRKDVYRFFIDASDTSCIRSIANKEAGISLKGREMKARIIATLIMLA